MPETATTKSGRNSALDFTKGALVLFMVLYHWLNYFVSTQGSFYRYLRFLTPSFIFITGFLVSNIYLAKYELSDARLPVRLLVRGLKLVAVFLVLNVAGGFVLRGSAYLQTIPEMFSNLGVTFASGNVPVVGGGRTASFSILVPIAYLLMLSAILLLVCRTRRVFQVMCISALVGIVLLELTGHELANLELLGIGFLGVLAGYTPIRQIDAFVKYRATFLVFAYACYTAAITRWGTIYPLQVIGVCLSVMLIYLLGVQDNQLGKRGQAIVLLGKYSLFGYIAQIAVLQVLRKVLGQSDLGSSAIAASFVAAFALTFLSVEVVDRARLRIPPVDRLYKAVFA